MIPAFNAVVPMACVVAAGIAAMIAEAFNPPNERMPIAPLGIIGLIGAALAGLAVPAGLARPASRPTKDSDQYLRCC